MGGSMLREIAIFPIFGKPLIMYGGIITLFCLVATALIAILNQKGIIKQAFGWHVWMARITIVLALVHGLLGIALFL